MGRSTIPPGIRFLMQRVPTLATPPATAYLLSRALNHACGLDLDSGWALFLVLASSFPVALVIQVQWQLFTNRRAAKRLGAVMPQAVKSAIPGGFDFLLTNPKKLYIGNLYNENAVKYGWTHNHRILFSDRYITSDPHLTKAVLTLHFDEFEKGAELSRTFHPVLGTGVFAADGDTWRFHRNMARPFFSKERISHFDNFDRHARDAIAAMQARFNEGFAVDFQDVVARFTLDSATEFLFGNDVQSLSETLPYPHFHQCHPPSDPDENDESAVGTVEGEHVNNSSKTRPPRSATQFVKAFTESLEIISQRLRFGDLWPLLLEFWADKLSGPMTIVNGYIDEIVHGVLQRKKDSSNSALITADEETDRDGETFLENLCNVTEDPVILRDAIMNMLVAGRDTTACGLTFTVYMLAEHPHVLERLRKEIVGKLGRERAPTYSDLKEMKFLRAVINETLRLYPPVPINMRVAKTSTVYTTPEGQRIFLPAKSRVMYASMAMHRRKDLWGPTAQEFDPDRFLDERLHKYLTPNPFIFLPFNAGQRICLGQQFAYNEMSFFLVRLMQTFSSIELCAESQPPDTRPPMEWASDTGNLRKAREKVKPRAHLTMYVEGGLWLRMGEDVSSDDLQLKSESAIA